MVDDLQDERTLGFGVLVERIAKFANAVGMLTAAIASIDIDVLLDGSEGDGT